MAKPLNRRKTRLERRQRGFVQGKNNSTRVPGSQSAHKTAPRGMGRRSRSKIQADSRNATV